MSEPNAYVEFYEFTVVPKGWQSQLDYLENICLTEDWKFRDPGLSEKNKNKNNPILENYVVHTFQRLKYEAGNMKDEEKNNKLFTSDQAACFNTGLFTQNYQYIYAYFEKNTNPHFEVPWYFKGFYEESNAYLERVYPLPRRANYFEDISDLLYDTNLSLRVNIDHIMGHELNKERIPPGVRENPNLTTLFNGAIDIAKKKIEANYKEAVPQYYKNEIQLLIPICLQDKDVVDVALAISKQDNYYAGMTCLTLDMAYNNARLIARPDIYWLKP